MSQVRRFDLVGITVAGPRHGDGVLRRAGSRGRGTRMFVEGDFLDTVIGIPESRTENHRVAG